MSVMTFRFVGGTEPTVFKVFDPGPGEGDGSLTVAPNVTVTTDDEAFQGYLAHLEGWEEVPSQPPGISKA